MANTTVKKDEVKDKETVKTVAVEPWEVQVAALRTCLKMIRADMQSHEAQDLAAQCESILVELEAEIEDL